MHLTIISDTHGEHWKLGTLSGEVLIHCGDMFNMFSSSEEELADMDAWFGEQAFDLIVCTGGNHDFCLERYQRQEQQPFSNAVFLAGSDFRFRGVNFYGAPWIPVLRGQAFYVDDEDLNEKWSDIPASVDVLITHTPPAGVLDVSSRGHELGCPHLMAAVDSCRPRAHCFGHVHASSGTQVVGATTYVNAAMVNSRYQLSRLPCELEI